MKDRNYPAWKFLRDDSMIIIDFIKEEDSYEETMLKRRKIREKVKARYHEHS